MVEAKYFKDYKHNYLILKCEGMEMGENYQYRMLASNKIDRILKCSVRNVNGETFLYYDISSKVSLKNLYQGRKMSYDQVKDFLWQMNMVYRSLGQFFMEERGLLIQPDCIYYDFTARQYFGLYYPIEDAQADNPYEPLMDFLLNHMETGNQKLVDIVYQIYEMSEEQFFSLSDALSLFEDTDGSVSTVGMIIEDHSDKEEIVEESAAVSVPKPDEDYGEEYDTSFDPAPVEKKVNFQIQQKKSNIFYSLFAFFSLCGIGAAIGIYYNFKLTQQELMMVICCSVLMGLCFLFSLIQILQSGQKNRKKEQEERALLYDIEDEFRDERPVAIQEVLDKNMALETAGNHSARQMTAYEGCHQVNRKGRLQTFCQKEQEDLYGETVFVNVQKQNIEYKLYALDKKNKKHIELTQFPFTIGKMAGCVDCVLADDSISRLHARIEKEDEKILLTDMNSTNGTYKNGLRMEPSETVEIEPGDEIRFGKLNYCYR